MGESNPLMKPVVYDVEPKLTAHLSDFLMTKVFIEDDDGKWKCLLVLPIAKVIKMLFLVYLSLLIAIVK
jgi:hypothetical protein